MKTIDSRIDAYIDKSADFAKPILQHLRKMVHKACPQVIETIKWSFPHFEYNGAILCSMAAFKNHCAFGFWKAAQMKDPAGIFSKNAMGQFDRITSKKDLPADRILIAYLKEAASLNEEGIKLKMPVKAKPAVKKEIEIPAELVAELKKNKAAQVTFNNFSPSNKREYIAWISDAKTESTRNKRVTTAVAWMSEGKSRNWKYSTK